MNNPKIIQCCKISGNKTQTMMYFYQTMSTMGLPPLTMHSSLMLNVWEIHSRTCFQGSLSCKWCLLLTFCSSEKRYHFKIKINSRACFWSFEFRPALFHWNWLNQLPFLTLKKSTSIVVSSAQKSMPASVWGHRMPTLKMARNILCIFLGPICIFLNT